MSNADIVMNGTQDVIGKLMTQIRVKMDDARSDSDIVTLYALQKVYVDCQLIMKNMLARIYRPIVDNEQATHLRNLENITNHIKDKSKEIESAAALIKNVADWVGLIAKIVGKILVFLI